MALPKEYYADARTKKRLKELEERIERIDRDLEVAENTIVLLHENLTSLMDAYREGSFFFKSKQ